MSDSMRQMVEDAASSLAGEDGVFTYDDDDYLALSDDSSYADADNATVLLNCLPEIALDHLTITRTVADLVKIISDQQYQIAALAARLEQVETEKVAVALQAQGNDIIASMTEKGVSIGAHEYRVSFEATSSRRESGRRSTTESSTREFSVSIGAKLDRLITELVDLNISAGMDTRHSQKRRMEEAWTNHEKSSRSGMIHFRWENVEPRR